jgi:hypothetical protein
MRVTGRKTVFSLAAAAGVCALLAPAPTASPGRTLALRPAADAYSSAADSTRNFGRARTLLVRRTPRARSYLRFSVSRLDGPVRRATLRLFARSGRGTYKVAALTSNRWSEGTLTAAKAPPVSRAVASARVRGPGWTEINVTPLVRANGVVGVALAASGRGAITFASREAGARAPRLVVVTGPAAPDPVIAAAGNIACDPLNPAFNGGLGTATECRHKYTSDLLVGGGFSRVLMLGDAQYQCGGYTPYQQVYGSTWGRVKGITRPVPGNHDYRASSPGTDCDPTQRPTGYFRYFGAAAGPANLGYYSFDLGAWHVIALNSNCAEVGGCGPGSPQETWLRRDLAANRSRCTLAYWHHARFSSSWQGEHDHALEAFWRALDAARAEVILSAHDHVYERFAPQDAAGTAAAAGIRQFTVGTGGVSHHPFFAIHRNSQVRNNDTFGVLKLTLRAARYEWQFVPEAGKSFTDSGSAPCR